MPLPFTLNWDAPGDFTITMNVGTILSLTALPKNDDDQAGTIHYLKWYTMKIGGGRHNLWQGEFNDAASGPVQLSFTVDTSAATVGIYTSIGNAIVRPNQTQTFTFNRSSRGFTELKITEGEFKAEKVT